MPNLTKHIIDWMPQYVAEAYGHIIDNGEELSPRQFAMLLAIHYDLGNPRNRSAYDYLRRIDEELVFTRDRLHGTSVTRTHASLYKPHHCRQCFLDDFRLIDYRPMLLKSGRNPAYNADRIICFWECKKCKTREIVKAELK